MAKRFTDSDKFTDPWFRRLSTKNKVLWDWMLCSCDFAGFISIDLEFVEIVLGEKFEDDVIEKFFNERVLKLSEFKYFIPKFIKFQYGALNPDSRVHKSVIKKISDHGIDYMRLDTLSIPYPYPTGTLKEKEKDKDKDTSLLIKEEDSVPKIDNVIQLFNDNCAGKGRISHCRGLSSKNINEFFTTTSFAEFQKINTWHELFSKTGSSPFLTGAQPGSSFVATLDWLVVHDNALKVLNGKYGKGSDKNTLKSKQASTISEAELNEARELGII